MTRSSVYINVAFAAMVLRKDARDLRDYLAGEITIEAWRSRAMRNADDLARVRALFVPKEPSAIHASIRPLRERALYRKASRRTLR
jgi:hypothetical protein